MKISLRKANALQTSINELLKNIKVETTISITEFENPSEKILLENTNAFVNHSRKIDLINVLYALRKAVGKANAESGIDDLLTSVAMYTKLAEEFNVIASADVMTDIGVITSKLAKIAGRTEDIYGRDAVGTSICTADDISKAKTFVQKMKKNKQRVLDGILELNIRIEIQLDKDAVDVLTKEDLL